MRYSLEQCNKYARRKGFDVDVQYYTVLWTNTKPVSPTYIVFYTKNQSKKRKVLLKELCRFPVDEFRRYTERKLKVKKILNE